MPSALVCLLPGLGDALVASPVLSGLRDSGVEFDVLTMLGPVTTYARDLGYAREVIESPLLDLAPKAIPQIAGLRKQSYDSVFVPFPATRWQYAAVAAAIGGRETWIHRYNGTSSAIATAFRMNQIPLSGGHRISENLRLAEAANLPAGNARYEIPAQWQSGTRVHNLLGIHPGSMRYKGNERRRWPIENFGRLASLQVSAGRSVRVYLGPNECEDRAILNRLCPAAEFVEAPLAQAARSISQCEVFVGNDSGLVHLAGALNVKVLALFGMTEATRAQPLGHSVAVHPSDCPPCFDEGRRTFECVRALNYKCIREDMSVDLVNDLVDRAFKTGIPQFVPAVRGPFRLYGKLA